MQLTSETIKDAIENLEDSEEVYGLIENWDVSTVTDMSRLFRNTVFDDDIDISKWDVSNVTDMSDMFNKCDFNRDISGWNVSKVTDMTQMFSYSAFNQDISGWDVSNVTEMSGMFYAGVFNQNISNWDVSNVINMEGMFSFIDVVNIPPWYTHGTKLEMFSLFNYEQQDGVAFEVHNKFNNINIILIKKLIYSIPGIRNNNPFNISIKSYNDRLKLNDLIHEKVEELYNVSDEIDHRKKQIVMKRFLSYVYDDKTINSIIKPVFMYMWSKKWNSHDRIVYINMWINDSATAYDNGNVEDKVSCIQGIIERMVFTIANVTSMKEEKLSAIQRRIQKLMTPESKKPLSELFNMWQAIVCKDDELKKKSNDELTAHFREYIANKVEKIPGHTGYPEDDMNVWADNIEYIDCLEQRGGRNKTMHVIKRMRNGVLDFILSFGSKQNTTKRGAATKRKGIRSKRRKTQKRKIRRSKKSGYT